jgi:hypothetical protein
MGRTKIRKFLASRISHQETNFYLEKNDADSSTKDMFILDCMFHAFIKYDFLELYTSIKFRLQLEIYTSLLPKIFRFYELPFWFWGSL